jgi:hypothetical protein
VLRRGSRSAREKGASGVGVLAGHFPAGRGEHEGVFAQQIRLFFYKCLAGVGKSLSERESYGSNTRFISHHLG